MERYAKALVVLLVGIIGYIAAKAGLDVPLDKLEVIVTELVTMFFVFLVPNRPPS